MGVHVHGKCILSNRSGQIMLTGGRIITSGVICGTAKTCPSSRLMINRCLYIHIPIPNHQVRNPTLPLLCRWIGRRLPTPRAFQLISHLCCQKPSEINLLLHQSHRKSPIRPQRLEVIRGSVQRKPMCDLVRLPL